MEIFYFYVPFRVLDTLCWGAIKTDATLDVAWWDGTRRKKFKFSWLRKNNSIILREMVGEKTYDYFTWNISPIMKTIHIQETISPWFVITNSWLRIGAFLPDFRRLGIFFVSKEKQPRRKERIESGFQALIAFPLVPSASSGQVTLEVGRRREVTGYHPLKGVNVDSR